MFFGEMYIPVPVLILGAVVAVAILVGGIWLITHSNTDELNTGGTVAIPRSEPDQTYAEETTAEEDWEEDENPWKDKSDDINLRKGQKIPFGDTGWIFEVLRINDDAQEVLGKLIVTLDPGVKAVDIDRHMATDEQVGVLGFVITIDPPGRSIDTITYDASVDDWPMYEDYTLVIDEISVEETPAA